MSRSGQIAVAWGGTLVLIGLCVFVSGQDGKQQPAEARPASQQTTMVEQTGPVVSFDKATQEICLASGKKTTNCWNAGGPWARLKRGQVVEIMSTPDIASDTVAFTWRIPAASGRAG